MTVTEKFHITIKRTNGKSRTTHRRFNLTAEQVEQERLTARREAPAGSVVDIKVKLAKA